MRIAGIPFVAEGLRTYASQRSILRTYLVIPGALAVSLLVAWPQGTADSVFRGAAITDSFSVVAVTFLLFLLYLGGRYGAEDYSPDTLVNLREYVTLTPASVTSLVAGKAAFALLHTVFLLALGAPFLLAAFSVSGTRAGTLAVCLAVLAAAAYTVRMYGLLLLALLGPRRLLRGAAFVASLAVFLFGTYLVLPSVNPIAVLLAARDASATGAASAGGGASATGGGLSPSAFLVLFDAAAALLLAMATGLVLEVARRRGRQGDRGRPESPGGRRT